MKSTIEMNKNEIVEQKSVHEIEEKKEMNCKIQRKNSIISHFYGRTKRQTSALL